MVNKRTVGLDITVGHLRINSPEVVMKSVLGGLPIQVMNDGAVVPLNTELRETVAISAQPDRVFAVVTFTSPMVMHDLDIQKWLKEGANISKANLRIHSSPYEVVEQLKDAEGLSERLAILD